MATSSVGRLDYDENLLESAPAATKAQLQSGYNPDLLKDKPTASMSSRQDLTLPPNRDAEKQLPPPKTPFYRTTKGILIILVAAAVVIAAVVGGAVGGTKKHHSSAIAPASGQSTGQSGQGAGQAGGAGSAASGASSQSTVGAASSTISGQSQAEQTQSATSSSANNINPGGPIAGFPTSIPPPAAPSPSGVFAQEVGLLADIGH